LNDGPLRLGRETEDHGANQDQTNRGSLEHAPTMVTELARVKSLSLVFDQDHKDW
jgi:hypothetical protein